MREWRPKKEYRLDTDGHIRRVKKNSGAKLRPDAKGDCLVQLKVPMREKRAWIKQATAMQLTLSAWIRFACGMTAKAADDLKTKPTAKDWNNGNQKRSR